jgi:hypothetical protein
MSLLDASTVARLDRAHVSSSDAADRLAHGDRDAVRQLGGGTAMWARVAQAGLLPAAIGLVAAASGSGVELRDVGAFVLMALVFALAEVVIQTGPFTVRRRPNLFRLGTAAVLLFGLVASGAIGPST